MSINISAFAGAGAQFFDANGAPLSGGLIYSYLAGTTTAATTFTSRAGTSNNTNPIVLDAAGRTPAEIWLTGGLLYKFILKSSTFVQIGSYDNIPAIDDVTSINTLITVAGTNTLTGLASPTLAAYVAGAQYSFIAQNTNTAAVTLDIDTLGAKSITKAGSVALSAGDIVAGALYQIAYDGTRFQLLTRTSTSQLVVGTTAQRPSSPTTGMVRMNTDTKNPEWYDTVSAQWLNFNQTSGYSVNYLVIAGGGGGGAGVNGAQPGGGGGAGGLLSSSASFATGTAYTITVGSGGASGTVGSNSSISSLSITALGGGAGANSGAVGGNGGSGGGGVLGFATGAGTTGQGFAGGIGLSNGAGGGGGGSATGGNATVANGGVGGAGASNSISGSAVTYAGGGGGGGGTTAGAGGAGGGAAGGTATVGANATANTGGGGGGGGNNGVSAAGGNGGSGIVILAYLGAQRGTGGTVTTSGGYTIHTFTSSSTYNA